MGKGTQLEQVSGDRSMWVFMGRGMFQTSGKDHELFLFYFKYVHTFSVNFEFDDELFK